MKYKKYISTVFIAMLLLPLLSAKSTPSNIEEFDVSSIKFIEEEQQIDLGFDTKEYLPEDFDPYQEEVSVNGINFMEEENIDLGFDTSEFLPEDFNPYEK
ncbi:hypothetical protein MTsPCn9_20670 [Croceitalea sp. MTPC9]|uniref:hypothetical protein n=1 Tax=unclassified Croceitalea TaxID=2632280 RepID=UPI002B3D30A2|nr:hypothetical protein MTsPCn6_25590 [Croceitalea sp. MTPC6]GMN17131.1 hypothetical protein MTsPCn9_20670 [Croceitalea sp. MTPC9]